MEYYDLDGTPMRRKDPYKFPEILQKGVWREYQDLDRFAHNADPISEERFNEMVAERTSRAA